MELRAHGTPTTHVLPGRSKSAPLQSDQATRWLQPSGMP